VTVAVVTYNSGDVLRGLLAALPGAMVGVDDHALAIVDNASSDRTLEVVAQMAPDATVVQMGRNAGYAAGVNAAFARLPPSDALLVLNPDSRPGPGSGHQLLQGLLSAGTGITVPRIVDRDSRLEWSLRREPTVLRTLGEAVLGGERAGRLSIGEVIVGLKWYDHDAVADWATGAVMMISRACLDEVGPWDESYFLYSEETDFALRARDAGFALRLTTSAEVVHLGGAVRESPRLWALLTMNRLELYRRRHGTTAALAFRTALILNELLRSGRRRGTHRAALRALVGLDDVERAGIAGGASAR
jgi:GT2 family glycosyltransferase